MKQIKDETAAALIDVLKSIDMTNEIPRAAQDQIKNYIAELENLHPVETEAEWLEKMKQSAAAFNRVIPQLVPYEPVDWTGHEQYGVCAHCTHVKQIATGPECGVCRHIDKACTISNWRPKDGDA